MREEWLLQKKTITNGFTRTMVNHTLPKICGKQVAGEWSTLLQNYGNHGIEGKDRERTEDGPSTLSSGHFISAVGGNGKIIGRGR